jgi:hypothetical protein
MPAQLTFDAVEHRYFLNNTPVPGVTAVLEHGGLLDYTFLEARRDQYLERGRAVHEVTRHHDEGDLAEGAVSDEIRGYLQAWRAFRRDYDFEPCLVEQMVCDPQYGYAGCIDRTGRTRDGAEVILDLKTGAAPAAVRYQLAAYAGCLEHPRAYRRLCVELHGNGNYRVIGFEVRDFQRDFDVFVRALETFKTKRGEV